VSTKNDYFCPKEYLLFSLLLFHYKVGAPKYRSIAVWQGGAPPTTAAGQMGMPWGRGGHRRGAAVAEPPRRRRAMGSTHLHSGGGGGGVVRRFPPQPPRGGLLLRGGRRSRGGGGVECDGPWRPPRAPRSPDFLTPPLGNSSSPPLSSNWKKHAPVDTPTDVNCLCVDFSGCHSVVLLGFVVVYRSCIDCVLFCSKFVCPLFPSINRSPNLFGRTAQVMHQVFFVIVVIIPQELTSSRVFCKNLKSSIPKVVFLFPPGYGI